MGKFNRIEVNYESSPGVMVTETIVDENDWNNRVNDSDDSGLTILADDGRSMTFIPNSSLCNVVAYFDTPHSTIADAINGVVG